MKRHLFLLICSLFVCVICFAQTNYYTESKVFDEEGYNVIKLHSAYDENTQIIEYVNKDDELLGILILMVLELIYE